MEQNTMLTQEQLGTILTQYTERMKNLFPEVKGKKFIRAQHEFVMGAICGIDTVMNNTSSCIPPNVFTALLRGELIKTIDNNQTVGQ